MKTLATYFVRKILVPVLVCVLSLSSHLSAEEQISTEELMNLPIEDLLNMQISVAGKKAEKIKDIPASVVVITREDIKKYGFQTLHEILENVPGMYMTDEYNISGTMNYGVRGFYTPGIFANMAVLINGVQPFNDTPVYQMDVPIEAIDRIEIVRGPMSVIYGSGAFFGAIDIITDGRYDEKPVSLASASAGNLNTYKLFSRVSGRLEDISYSLNASYETDDGIDEPYSKMMTNPSIVTESPPQPGSAYNRPFETTKGTLQYENKQFSASVAYQGLTADFRMFHRERGSKIFAPTDDPEGPPEQKYATALIGYEKEIYDWLTVAIKGSYAQFNYESHHDFFYPYFFWGYTASYDTYGLEIDAVLKPAPDLNIIMGLSRHTMDDYFENQDAPKAWVPSLINMNIFTDPITTNSLFVQADWKLFGRFRLVGGIRFDNNETYEYVRAQVPEDAIKEPAVTKKTYEPDKDIEIIPRLALIYDLNANNVLKLMYGKAIKRPFLARIFENPLVKSEEIQTYEINYIGSLAPNLTVNASVFRNEAENLISSGWSYNPSTGAFYMTSENVGELSTTGAEIVIQAKLFKNLDLDLGVTYQDTENERDGFEDIEPGYAPKWLGYFKAAYEFPKHITFAVTGRYVDNMKADWDYIYGVDKTTGLPVVRPDDPKGGRLGYETDDYFVFNTNMRAEKLFGTGFYLNLNVSNLFDEEIHYPTTESLRFTDLGTLGYGRRYLATIGYEW
jgi:outer membrane receptor protein involved in Fe transport